MHAMKLLSKVIAASNLDIQCRLVEEDDKPFLSELYGTTRAAELAQVPWTDEQKQEFIDMQFNAQYTFYNEQFTEAEFGILSKNTVDIGRLYMDQRDDDLRIIDIALMPNYQKMGIGKALLQGAQQVATELKLPITIHVEKNNPAMRLYKHLGFEMVEDQGVYDLMRWETN